MERGAKLTLKVATQKFSMKQKGPKHLELKS